MLTRNARRSGCGVSGSKYVYKTRTVCSSVLNVKESRNWRDCYNSYKHRTPTPLAKPVHPISNVKNPVNGNRHSNCVTKNRVKKLTIKHTEKTADSGQSGHIEGFISVPVQNRFLPLQTSQPCATNNVQEQDGCVVDNIDSMCRDKDSVFCVSNTKVVKNEIKTKNNSMSDTKCCVQQKGSDTIRKSDTDSIIADDSQQNAGLYPNGLHTLMNSCSDSNVDICPEYAQIWDSKNL